ncbi:MAG: hypothetical protein QXO12_01960 [Candidatus Pacearchaeota archaeon]
MKKIKISLLITILIFIIFSTTIIAQNYAEYNFSGNYTKAGHKAWKSANAGSKPPSGGPNVPNEVELSSTEYDQISASDDVRAFVASATYRTFRFMFKLNQSASQIVNLTIAWEGYSTGTTAVQRRVDLYVWNFTSNSWSASLANNNLSADYWLRYTFTNGFSDIVNSTNHIIFLVEAPSPGTTRTLYTDTANISVWYNLGPNVTLVSPSNGSVTTSNAINFTCNATDDLQLSNITFYWNYSGSWQANGTVAVSGTSNSTTFQRTGLNNGAILWNCYACDNESACSFAPTNWTVTIVNQPPQITLNQPTNNTIFNDTQEINFNFTVTDDQNTTLSCSIYLDDVLNQTNASVQNNTLTNFLIQGISYGNHNWSISCTDGELSNVSETRYFTINDTIAPNIYFNQNTDENGTYRKNWIFINITCSDINKDNVILNWNGNNESFDNNIGDIYWENKTGLNDGIYTFYAFCNDSYSNVNQTEIRSITLDTTAPNVILNYPNNGLVTGNTIITFNCSAYDSIDLANITLWHNATGWQQNETKPLTGYSNSTIFTKTFVEGSYLWSCSACDSLGNCNESFVENRTFTIDLDSPIISYVFPTDIDNIYVSRLWTFVNVTAYDENGIDACILNWDGANETMSKVELDNNNVYCYINKTDVEGNHIYNVYVNDSAGNIAIAGERNITFDITPPIIENVEVTNITTSSAIIKWETNEYTNSSINYGINISLGNLISNSTFVLNHSILITNLKSKTLYYFNITSCDFVGNCNTKGIFNFTTYGKSDTGGKFEINETNETNQNITMENITKQNISEESKIEKKEKIVCNIGDIIGICNNIRESEGIYFVYNGETHKIIINKINKDNVDITIYSFPINTILKLKEPRFFDITNDNIEDIKVILEEIDYLTKKATIRIEIIECKCPECGEWSKCINNKKTRECYICNKETNFECISFKEEKPCKEGCKFICWYWLLFIFILLLTIIFIFWRREEETDLEKKLKQIEYNLRTNGYDWKIKGISR